MSHQQNSTTITSRTYWLTRDYWALMKFCWQWIKNQLSWWNCMPREMIFSLSNSRSLWSRWEIYLLWQVQGETLEQIAGWLILGDQAIYHCFIKIIHENCIWIIFLCLLFFPWWVDYLESIASVSTLGNMTLDNILVCVSWNYCTQFHIFYKEVIVLPQSTIHNMRELISAKYNFVI